MTAQALPLSPTAELAALRATVDFGSDTADILNAHVPLVARMTLATLAAMVAAGIALATLLPVERVVSARGRISAEAPRIMVQPLETSIIRAINVRTGQTVKAGDILATLDPTFSTADVSALRREVASLDAEIARLTAEVAGKPFAPTNGDLFSTLQKKIYDSRNSQFQSAVATYAGKIASQQATIKQTEQELALYKQRLGIVSEVEGMKSELASRKIVARADLLSVTDTRVEVQRGIASAEGQLESARHELDALNSQFANFKEKWQTDTISLLRAQYHLAADDCFLIIGGDSLGDLPTWHDAAKLITQCRLAVSRRPGYQPDLKALEATLPGVSAQLNWVDMPALGLVASDIRARAQNEQSIRYQVTDKVRQYIEQHQLYTSQA